MYKSAQKSGSAPTRQQLLDTAAAWVRYANVTKGYHVRYWEIGNESYLSSYNGQATAQQYAQDLVDFSTVMKAVDPTIKIGANGHDDLWWSTILPVAAEKIDFLVVHMYPLWAWGSYDYYRAQSHNFLRPVDTALEAIKTAAPASEQARLQVAVTEFNAIDYAEKGTWPNANDLGHALVVFDIMGQILSQPRLAFAQFWATRWVNNQTAEIQEVSDALNQFNEFNPVGQALTIWGQLLGDQLVAVTAPEPILGYATYTPVSRQLTVLLLNKGTVERSLGLTVHNYHAAPWAKSWVFTGNGPTDTRPTWTRRPDIRVEEPHVSATLAPLSVTAVLFEGSVDAMSFAKPEFRLVTP
jgi:alpha-N-arabinofuranosidase